MTNYHVYCSCTICHKQTTSQSLQLHYKKCKATSINQCKQCGAKTSTKFCSRRCAAKFHNASRRIKKSPTVKRSVYAYTKISWCKCCGTLIRDSWRNSCSTHCMKLLIQEGGKKSAAKQIKRSVDEIALYNLCASHFIHVTHNEPIFNGWDADIIIHDTKTAILWNGPWHYREMPGLNHSLKQVQNRDMIKLKEIESAGWTALVFEDHLYTPHSAFQSILLRTLDSN